MERELYEEHAALERDQWWFVARRAILDAVLVRYLPSVPARRILDVGCGTGGMLPMLARFGDVSGIEGDEQAVEHCRDAFAQFEVLQGEIPGDVPADGDLDLVTAFDVIEHIDDDLAALASLRAAVRPGGLVVLTVPALQWLWSDHDRVNGHRRRYTRHSLVDLIGRTDLELVHVSYFNTVLLPVVAASRLSQRVRRRPALPHSDFSMPPSWLNALLERLMSGERRSVIGTGLPIGVSLVAVAVRPRSSG